MGAFRNFSKRFPLLVGLLVFAFLWCGVQYVPQPLGDSNLGWAIKEFLLMLACGVLAILFVGPSLFKPSTEGFRYTLKKSAYYLIVNVGILGLLVFLFTAITRAMTGGSADYFQTFLLAFVLAACIGVVEEIVFRVFLFGGLVAKMGSTRAGLFGAAIISSLIFGFIHVMGSLFVGASFTGDYVLQVVGKTLQSGMMGFFMCAVYVKTRNFWCIAGLHMLSDFFGLWVSFAGNTEVGTYTGGGGTNGLFYVFMILINIPVLITSIKMLLSASLPQESALVSDNYLPCTPPDEKKPKTQKEQKH